MLRILPSAMLRTIVSTFHLGVLHSLKVNVRHSTVFSKYISKAESILEGQNVGKDVLKSIAFSLYEKDAEKSLEIMEKLKDADKRLEIMEKVKDADKKFELASQAHQARIAAMKNYFLKKLSYLSQRYSSQIDSILFDE